MSVNYRAEVDGLRAIAVVSVILFHAEMVIFGRDWFEGGYIGVDIFFVISGYLITRLILSELFETGAFSFLNFYERRVRRILPMLFTVMLVSIPFAWFLLLPSDFEEYSKSILSAVFFSSNFFFYYATTEYAADSALLKPFLHTWSLGIEEQFYIVFPALVLLFRRFAGDHLLALFVVMLLASIQFAELMQGRNSELNFYLPMSRFWELLTGSILAWAELKHGRISHDVAAGVMPVLGLYLIGYSILSFDVQSPHPGFATLMPVAGTALIILFSSSRDLVGAMLGSKPFVAIGLISYSAYLWHFPVFAFLRLSEREPANVDKLGWIALTLLLSAISYFLVEKPFRKRSTGVRKLFAFTGGTFAVIVLANGYVVGQDGFLDRMRISDSFVLDKDYYARQSRAFEMEFDYSHRNDERIDVLIVGDSHAEDMLRILDASEGLRPFYAFNLTSPRVRDDDYNYQVSCFWRLLEQGSTYCAASPRNNDQFTWHVREQYDNAQVIVLAPRWIRQDFQFLGKLLRQIKSDHKVAVVVDRTLEMNEYRPYALNDLDNLVLRTGTIPGPDELMELEQTVYGYLSRMEPLNSDLEQIANEEGAYFLRRSDYLCDHAAGRCRLMTDAGHKTLLDYGHVTSEGAQFFADRIDEISWFPVIEP